MSATIIPFPKEAPAAVMFRNPELDFDGLISALDLAKSDDRATLKVIAQYRAGEIDLTALRDHFDGELRKSRVGRALLDLDVTDPDDARIAKTIIGWHRGQIGTDEFERIIRQEHASWQRAQKSAFGRSNPASPPYASRFEKATKRAPAKGEQPPLRFPPKGTTKVTDTDEKKE